MSPEKSNGTMRDNKLSEQFHVPPLSSIFVSLLILLLIVAFFKGTTYRFYASFLFLFYSLTKHMWVSVIMLGIFQTLILMPLRIIRLWKSDNISEFQKKIQSMETHFLQQNKFKESFGLGNRSFLFYLLDFTIQLTTFLTIGRLFLTDFYLFKLDPGKLYSWVPYPQYPIAHTFFKFPYLSVTQTTDLGWHVLIIVWILALMGLGFILYQRKRKNDRDVSYFPKYTWAYIVLIMLISWLLIRNFPVGWTMKIFVGDVSKPNRTLNTVTAVVTFLTLLWFGARKIMRKGKLAEEHGIDEKVIEATQRKMFSQSVFDSSVVGLGAYFITNQIPSAFELSIFTLEIISLFSPLTLDKLILKNKSKFFNKKNQAEKAVSAKADQVSDE